jgi:MerR family transcriptional regulator, light-induced transcriptional regulator
MSMLKSLTTKEVARLCCVSDATVKRWEDSGLLASERTNGGHRRFRVDEIARFQRAQGLGQKKSNGDESVITAAFRRRENEFHSNCELFNSLITGSEEGAANVIISEFLNDKSLENIIDELISPALSKIGQLWFEGKLTIAQEHLATRTVINAIQKLRCVVPVAESNRMPAICCTIEGDFHELPAHFAQIILENEGFEVINFGANMPVYALCDEITKLSPKLICISSTILSDVDRLSRDFRSFSEKLCRLNATVILGGRAFEEPHIRNRFPADFYAKSFDHFANFVRQLPITTS